MSRPYHQAWLLAWNAVQQLQRPDSLEDSWVLGAVPGATLDSAGFAGVEHQVLLLMFLPCMSDLAPMQA